MAKKPSPKKIASNTKDVLKYAKQTEVGLEAMVDKHQARLSSAITELENRIVDQLSEFKASDGRLLGPQANLKLAQKIHRDLDDHFQRYYGSATRQVVDGFGEANKYIENELSVWGDASNYTGVDRDMIKTLKDSAWGTFNSIGEAAKEQLVDAMYGAIAGRRPFSELLSDFRQALSGEKDAVGRSMDRYAKTFTNDAIMTYHNEVNMLKSERLGIKHFLYYGNAMITTRPFCRERIGETFPKDEIESWTFGWQGKSGPALTNRGGYNCRHRWVAVRPTQVDPTELVKDLKPPPKVKPPPKPKKRKPKKKVAIPAKKTTKSAVAQTVMLSPDDLKTEYLAAKREFNAITKGRGYREWKYHRDGVSVDHYLSIYQRDRKLAEEVAEVYQASERMVVTRAAYIDSLAPAERIVERKKILGKMTRYGNFPKRRGTRFKRLKPEEFFDSKDVTFTENVIAGRIHAGTQHMSTRILLDLERSGYQVRVIPQNSKTFRAFHDQYSKSINIAFDDAPEVVAHELAHAIDVSLSLGESNHGMLWLEDARYNVKGSRDAIRKAYEKARSGRIGTYKSGDGKYDIGNWIDSYEGRIYSGDQDFEYATSYFNRDKTKLAREGVEFFSVNVQRYNRMYSSARVTYNSRLQTLRNQITKLEQDLNRIAGNSTISKKEREALASVISDEIVDYQTRIRSTSFSDILEDTKKTHRDWTKVRTHYPGLTDAIEKLFEETLT